MDLKAAGGYLDSRWPEAIATPPSRRPSAAPSGARGRPERSPRKLAELVEINRTYMEDVARGERNLAQQNMSKIARALDMRLIQLVRLMENEKPVACEHETWSLTRARGRRLSGRMRFWADLARGR